MSKSMSNINTANYQTSTNIVNCGQLTKTMTTLYNL